MGVSLRTALVIKGNGDNIKCEANMLTERLWSGAVVLYHGDVPHETLLTSTPVYESRKAAIAAMTDVVEEIRATKIKLPAPVNRMLGAKKI